MAKKAIQESEQRKLHTKSGNRCALCKMVLVDNEKEEVACIGENAHIYGENPGSARYNDQLDDKYINSEQNLIFLCCNCHKKIDTEILLYPANVLIDKKKEHEAWVIKSLEEQSVNFTFAELQVLSDYLINSTSGTETPNDLTLIKISDKIKRNKLEEVQKFVTMGLTNVSLVRSYINCNPDTNFSIRLTNSIVKTYNELKRKNSNPIDIFYSLWEITSGKQNDFLYKTAGLSILIYFFEECEVFEK